MNIEEVVSMGRDQMQGCPENNWVEAVDEYYKKVCENEDLSWLEHEPYIQEAIIDASYEGEQNSRQFSPFEFTAKELNELEETASYEVWEAFEEGIGNYMDEWWKDNLTTVQSYWEELQVTWDDPRFTSS